MTEIVRGMADPVSTIDHESTNPRTDAMQRFMACASFLTIMQRQIDGRSETLRRRAAVAQV